jgi:hypothetical protein
MELLNRYLHAVGFWLPKPQQQDIIAELGEDLRAQIEEREAALGHPLDDDGVAAILKQRGHPMLVAGRYLPQRSLIGPALFPAYQFILRLVIGWILTPIFILVVGPATVVSSRDPSAALIWTAWTLAMAGVVAFGIITLIFAILERYPHESTLKWDPLRLPRVTTSKAAAPPQPVSRFNGMVEAWAGIAAGLIWIDAMRFPVSLEVHGVDIALAPVWHRFFWPILLVTLGRAAAGLIVWLRPWWMRANLSVRLAVDAVTLVLIAAIAAMGPWVRVAASDLPAAGVASANDWANAGMWIGLTAAWLITLVATVRSARRLARRDSPVARRPSPKSANSSGWVA